MPIKYIGRVTDFKGKTLWEIVGNLKNMGVGRMVIRNRFQRYPEPSYYRIVKVAAQPATENEYVNARKVTVLVEKVFRGQKVPGHTQIDSASYKADYVLIPKDEEHLYTRTAVHKKEILPRYIELPPLLKECVKRKMKELDGSVTEDMLKMELRLNKTGIKNYKIAEEGEKPTVNVTLGLGTPASPSLYANVNFDKS